jgi:two-component system sensor histidine kinase PilS (NtrC family)
MPAVSDDQKTLTALVMRESDRLSRLLSEFLDFARVRVAKTEAVDLARIARDAASLAAAHPDRDSSVRVTCVIPEGDDVEIEGDEDLLHRAVFNLALNAVQASPASSEVRVEVARGCFDLSGGNRVRGRGRVTARQRLALNPRGIRDRMFDPSRPKRTAAAWSRRRPPGYRAHRGLVFVDNGLRGGTRFTVICQRRSCLARVFDDRTRRPSQRPCRRRRSGILDSLNILLRNEFTPHLAHGGRRGSIGCRR